MFPGARICLLFAWLLLGGVCTPHFAAGHMPARLAKGHGVGNALTAEVSKWSHLLREKRLSLKSELWLAWKTERFHIPVEPRSRVNKLAILAAVLGAMALLTITVIVVAGLIGGITSVLAVVAGLFAIGAVVTAAVALLQIRRRGDRGSGWALAGMILGANFLAAVVWGAVAAIGGAFLLLLFWLGLL